MDAIIICYRTEFYVLDAVERKRGSGGYRTDKGFIILSTDDGRDFPEFINGRGGFDASQIQAVFWVKDNPATIK